MPLIGGTVEHVLLVPLLLDGRARAVWIQGGRVKVGVQAQTHPGKAAGSVRGGVSGEVFPFVPGVHGHSDLHSFPTAALPISQGSCPAASAARRNAVEPTG